MFIAFADALPLHYLILFSFSKFHARRFAFSEDLCRHLSHLRMTCLPFASQYSAFPTSRAGRIAFSEDLYRFLSHLRMPCFNFTSYISFSAVSHRPVRVIRVSTRKKLALRGLCTNRVFDPRFVSCWQMFADLSVVRRHCVWCLLKLRSRLRQTQHRMQIIDPSRVIRSFRAAALKRDSCRLFASLPFRLPHVIYVFCNFRPSDNFRIFLAPAFSLETSEISVEIDTVYLLLYDLYLISIRIICVSFDTFAKS